MCCDTLGYVHPSDRWDHVEEAMEASERQRDAEADRMAEAEASGSDALDGDGG